MTTICPMDCNESALLKILGNSNPVALCDGAWTQVPIRTFEDLVRNLAYGLMVKDFRRGQTVCFTGCTDNMKPFINTACCLAHLDADFSQSGEVTVDVQEIPYLMTIGNTWSRKYKSSVDRTLTRIALGC